MFLLNYLNQLKKRKKQICWSKLETNMCLSSGEGEFCEWLLKIGNGEISNLKVPEKCLVQSIDESITSVYDFKALQSKSNFMH